MGRAAYAIASAAQYYTSTLVKSRQLLDTDGRTEQTSSKPFFAWLNHRHYNALSHVEVFAHQVSNVLTFATDLSACVLWSDDVLCICYFLPHPTQRYNRNSIRYTCTQSHTIHHTGEYNIADIAIVAVLWQLVRLSSSAAFAEIAGSRARSFLPIAKAIAPGGRVDRKRERPKNRTNENDKFVNLSWPWLWDIAVIIKLNVLM